MVNEGKGLISLYKIQKILKELSSINNPPSARLRFARFPSFAEHIANLFEEDRLFDIISRMQIQIDIVSKYNPPVRPALDPYISSQIGVFTRLFNDREIGFFVDYPECCVQSFIEEVRYGLDERHFLELTQSKGQSKGNVFVTTAGFVPCSVFCEESKKRGLIGFLDNTEVDRLKELEKELARKLPHFHPEYQEHYYDYYFS